MLKEGEEYLNTYVAPGNLVSISIFEDDHPSDNQLYHLVILHRGRGDTPIDKKDISGKIYSFEFYNFDNDWKRMCLHAIKQIDEGGFT